MSAQKQWGSLEELALVRTEAASTRAEGVHLWSSWRVARLQPCSSYSTTYRSRFASSHSCPTYRPWHSCPSYHACHYCSSNKGLHQTIYQAKMTCPHLRQSQHPSSHRPRPRQCGHRLGKACPCPVRNGAGSPCAISSSLPGTGQQWKSGKSGYVTSHTYVCYCPAMHCIALYCALLLHVLATSQPLLSNFSAASWQLQGQLPK